MLHTFIFHSLSDGVTHEIRRLREQQRKLQASASRIEETLKQLTTSQEQNFSSSSRKVQIPRPLSVRQQVRSCVVDVLMYFCRHLSMMCIVGLPRMKNWNGIIWQGMDNEGFIIVCSVAVMQF